MIIGLDHIVLLCPSIEDGETACSSLLGREPDWRTRDNLGSASVLYQMETMGLELMAPTGSGPMSRRLHTLLDHEGTGLQSLVFRSRDISETHRMMSRRGLRPDEVQPGESIDPERGAARSWLRFRLSDETTSGVKMFVLQRKADDPVAYQTAGESAVKTLDHVVVNTANPDRALALYGAKLGLTLALDRSNPAWDARLMFFRTGGVTVELAHRLSKGESPAPDTLWGLTWRVPDIEAAHARLTKNGRTLSNIRAGRAPGSRVFTIKDGTLGVPTLILASEPANPAP